LLRSVRSFFSLFLFSSRRSRMQIVHCPCPDHEYRLTFQFSVSLRPRPPPATSLPRPTRISLFESFTLLRHFQSFLLDYSLCASLILLLFSIQLRYSSAHSLHFRLYFHSFLFSSTSCSISVLSLFFPSILFLQVVHDFPFVINKKFSFIFVIDFRVLGQFDKYKALGRWNSSTGMMRDILLKYEAWVKENNGKGRTKTDYDRKKETNKEQQQKMRKKRRNVREISQEVLEWHARSAES
jgi:hypothetical protein